MNLLRLVTIDRCAYGTLNAWPTEAFCSASASLSIQVGGRAASVNALPVRYDVEIRALKNPEIVGVLSMRLVHILGLSAMAGLLGVSMPVLAAEPDPDDYP